MGVQIDRGALLESGPGDLMIILVTGAVGRGPTQLAAFDAALVAAGRPG